MRAARPDPRPGGCRCGSGDTMNAFTTSEPGAQDPWPGPGSALTQQHRPRRTPGSLSRPSNRRSVMDTVTDSGPGLSISSRSERGCVIAALSGELDITCAPALREHLLGLLRPGTGRLVIDLFRVSYADA